LCGKKPGKEKGKSKKRNLRIFSKEMKGLKTKGAHHGSERNGEAKFKNRAQRRTKKKKKKTCSLKGKDSPFKPKGGLPMKALVENKSKENAKSPQRELQPIKTHLRGVQQKTTRACREKCSKRKKS